VENLSYATPGSSRAILRGVSFSISPAEILGIIGSSGAGKSTLARQLVGVLLPSAGSVRLDGAEVAAWSRADFGRHVGYLPQDVELFADTVASNISRFDARDDAKVVDAAQLAGVHEMILRLPRGYETEVGEGGAVLSGGYRQRIGLARAVYGSPSLVILDEPSSNLDIAGDEALRECVLELKNRRTTVVLISHRPSTLCVVDKILVMQNGMLDLFGPRDEVIAHLMRPVPASRAAAKQAASS
jgi:ABC-type protease/lipase transport system fused ATPase/permease subunit